MPDQPEPFVERRKHQPRGRRTDDEANAEIVEHAVEDAPLVRRLLHTGKVAAAVGAICLPLGGMGAALGMKFVGPSEGIKAEAMVRARADTVHDGRIDLNAAAIVQLRRSTDSLVGILTDVRSELRINNYGQCVLMRKFAPEMRAPGCDASAGRGGGISPRNP